MLRRLKERKKDLQKRIAENQAFVDKYKNDIGPFLASYDNLCKEIESVYGDAKEKHAKGIQMLVKEFDYHIAYKRWSDNFTSTPFKPA